MPAEPPLIYPPPVDRLRRAAMRLAAELVEAREFLASAYVSMAADSMGPLEEAAVNDNRADGDVECEFELVLRQAQDDRKKYTASG